MMKYTGENKVAAALDDLLSYIEINSKEGKPINLDSHTVRKAIEALVALESHEAA